MLNEIFSNEWNKLALEYIENDTEEVELGLWKEMSSTVQEVYRVHRNTASQMKINNKVGYDVIMIPTVQFGDCQFDEMLRLSPASHL